jgi:hypothetical protein
MSEPSPLLMWHGAERLCELLATKKSPSTLKMWFRWRIYQTGECPRALPVPGHGLEAPTVRLETTR